MSDNKLYSSGASADGMRDTGTWWQGGEKVMVGKLGTSKPGSATSGVSASYSNQADRGLSEAPMSSYPVSTTSSFQGQGIGDPAPVLPSMRSPAEVSKIHTTLSDSVEKLESELRDVRRRWGGDAAHRDTASTSDVLGGGYDSKRSSLGYARSQTTDVGAASVTQVSSRPSENAILVQANNEKMESLLNEINTLSANFRVKQDSYEAQIAELQNQNATLAASNAKLVLQAAVNEASLKVAADNIIRDQEERAALIGPQTETCQHHLEEMTTMHKNYQEELDSARQKYEYAIAAKDMLKAEVDELQKQLVEASSAHPSNEAELRIARDEIARLEQRVASESSEKSAVEDRLKIELADTRKQLAASKEFGEEKLAELLQSKFTIAKLTDDVHMWRSNVDSAQEQLQLERERSENSSKNAQKLSQLVSNLEERLANEKAEKLQLNELAAVDKAELLKYRSDYKAMQRVVASERDQLKQEVEDLTKLLSKHMNHQDSESIAQMQVIRDLDESRKQQEELQAQITLMQAAEQKTQNEMLALREDVARRVREVEAEKQSVLAHAEEIQSRMKEWRKEKESLVFEREAKVRSLGEIKAERDSLLLELDKLKKENDFLAGELDGFRERIQGLDRYESQEMAKSNELQRKLRMVTQDRESLIAEMQQLRDSLSQTKEDSERAQALMRRRFTNEVDQMKQELQREKDNYRRTLSRADERVSRLKDAVYKELPATEDTVRDLKKMLDEERDNHRITRDRLSHLEGEAQRLMERDREAEAEIRHLRGLEHEFEQQMIRVKEMHTRELLDVRRAMTKVEDRAHDQELTINELREEQRKLDNLENENEELRHDIRVLKDKRIFQLKSGRGLAPVGGLRDRDQTRGADWGPVQLANTMDEWEQMEKGQFHSGREMSGRGHPNDPYMGPAHSGRW